MRRVLRVFGWLSAVVVVALLVLFLIARHPKPERGVTGPTADALAHEIEKSIDAGAWAKTGAVRWTYSTGTLHHLWDRQRNLDQVSWGEHRVLLDVHKQTGRAYTNGQEVTGDAKAKLLEKAYKRFINDSFWLNPLTKLFDDGVTRSVVDFEGKPALYVEYASGGVTPGDSYLWILDDNHRPVAWRLFVQILKVRGIQASWDGWTPLATGAQISTAHKMLGLTAVRITDLAGAATLSDLQPGNDPFEPIR